MCVWALVAASAVFWGLRLFTKPSAAPPQTQVAELAGAARGDLTRVLGADAPPPQASAQAEPSADARFNLVGVVSPRGAATAGGVALISVDGKAPKAFKLGAVVDGQNVLQSVNARGASLGLRGGPVLVALNIPPPQAPATGQLPPLGQQGAQPPARPMPNQAPTGGLPPQALQPLPPPPGQVPPQLGEQLK
jgi:general secretion pathway protein C